MSLTTNTDLWVKLTRLGSWLPRWNEAWRSPLSGRSSSQDPLLTLRDGLLRPRLGIMKSHLEGATQRPLRPRVGRPLSVLLYHAVSMFYRSFELVWVHACCLDFCPLYLFVFLLDYLSVCLSICLLVGQLVCLPIRLSLYVSAFLSVCLSVC